MDGVINVYKPTGMTSFDVVSKIRKISNTKKVGHTGTLDPEASGVLPICLGRATKIVDFIMNDYKIYKAELKLGIVTDSYDKEGTILEEKPINSSKEEIISAIKSFIGDIEQVPPMYSALKVNGKRLYELARKGIEIERLPRKVTIHDIEILEINVPDVKFIVKCSKGTYIRSLCYDIGRLLGCGGAMWGLERLATGDFTIENSIALADLTSDNISKNIIPMEDALNTFEPITLEDRFERLILNGVTIKDKSLLNNLEFNRIYRVYLKSNRFIGLGEKFESGFKIIKMLV